jgi:hypothetical protein
MLKRTILMAALLASSAAYAQVAPMPAPDVPDKSTTLTYSRVITLGAALGALDGGQKVITEGGKERVVPQPYDLSEATREAIADDEIALQGATEKVQSEARAFMRSLGGVVDQDDTEEHRTAKRQWDDFSARLGDREFHVALTKLNRTELKLGTNPIPPSVLAALAPVMGEAKK